ncbi:hypothetical protein PTKIN_Ptkin18bG0152500 [Pterospermum kingtungense]
MCAKTATIKDINEPFLIEAHAAVEAMDFALNCGFHEIILEGDALGVIKRLQSSNVDRSMIPHQIEEGRMKMSSFSHSKLQHVPRTSNEAAHQLAKLSPNLLYDCIWMEDYPACIKSVIDADMSLLLNE